MTDADYRIACARLEAANKWFREEIARLRLTDEEREAVEEMLHLIATRQTDYQREAHTLRKLLERLA